MKLRHLCAALLFIAAPALAQTPPMLTKDPAKVDAGTYAVEPNHTRVLFSLSHLGFTTYYGDFTGVSGTLTLDPAKPKASSLDISIPVGSISTTNAKLDDELKGDKWFDVAKYPAMTFKSTKVTPTGPGSAKVVGDLTLHGVTKPVTLDVKFNAGGANPMSKKYTVGFEVSGTLKRSDFGVSAYVPMLGDDVKLIISAAFEKQS